MNILIDTHILIYALGKTEKLSVRQKECLSNPENIFFVSYISLFEIAIKQSIGKLPEVESSIVEIEQAAIKDNFGVIPLTVHAMDLYRSIPIIKDHQDPFDRTIIAVAIEKQFSIMTNDSKFAQYQDIVQIWK